MVLPTISHSRYSRACALVHTRWLTGTRRFQTASAEPRARASEPASSVASPSPSLQRALRFGEPGRGATLAGAWALWRAPQLRIPRASSQRRWVRPRGAGVPGSRGTGGERQPLVRRVVPNAQVPRLGLWPGRIGL